MSDDRAGLQASILGLTLLRKVRFLDSREPIDVLVRPDYYRATGPFAAFDLNTAEIVTIDPSEAIVVPPPERKAETVAEISVLSSCSASDLTSDVNSKLLEGWSLLVPPAAVYSVQRCVIVWYATVIRNYESSGKRG